MKDALKHADVSGRLYKCGGKVPSTMRFGSTTQNTSKAHAQVLPDLIVPKPSVEPRCELATSCCAARCLPGLKKPHPAGLSKGKFVDVADGESQQRLVPHQGGDIIVSPARRFRWCDRTREGDSECSSKHL